MARRRKSGLDEVASWPWLMGIVAGILAFLLIRYGIGAWLASHRHLPVARLDQTQQFRRDPAQQFPAETEHLGC